VACEAAVMSESSPEASNVIEVSDADMAAAVAEETAEETGATEETGGPFSQKTAWVRRMETPLRNFLRTETGSASVLAAATVLALIWANVNFSSYERFWATRLAVFVGSWNVTLDLHEFVNSGLMALFFLVTFSVVDDLAGLVVIAAAYSAAIKVVPLACGLAFIALVLVLRARGVRNGILYLLIGIAAWVAFLKSGIDPIVVGLIFGLLTYAYSASRESLEQASEAFRQFREQPTAELAQSARTVVRTAISPNDR